MDTQTKQKLSPERILAVIALCAAGLLVIMVLLCLPCFGEDEDPQQELGGHMQGADSDMEQIQPSSGGPTEPPMPPPEANPYGKRDFQYDGMYLSCLWEDTVAGVDVSAYQGDVDWQKVAASGIRFAMVRLGYRGYGTGKLVEDEVALQNIQRAIDAGLDVGVYFFSQAVSVEEAREEAQFVLERIQGYDITMPVVFDWEYISDEARTANVDKRTLTDCYLAFCEAVSEAGYTPMAYFNWYQSTGMMYLTELEEYPFWLALYTDRMTYPYKIEMWQYTCTGKVPGIEGDVDIDLYFTGK